MDHYRILSIVLCPMELVLISYQFIYSGMYMSVPISQFIPPTLSPANRKFVFYISDSTEEAFINQVGKKQYFAFVSLGHSGVCSMDPYIQSGTHDYRDGDHHDLRIMEFPLTVLA